MDWNLSFYSTTSSTSPSEEDFIVQSLRLQDRWELVTGQEKVLVDEIIQYKITRVWEK